MEEDRLDFDTIIALDNRDSIHKSYRQIMQSGIMPAVTKIFYPRPWNFPVQFDLWLSTIRFFVKHKLLELQCRTQERTYLTVTNMDSNIQLTFYLIGAAGPTLHLRESTGHYFFTYALPSLHARAALAASHSKQEKTKYCKIKDPTIEEIGDPSNLQNYLPDSGATQHMTPHLSDLIDMVEGQNLGVEAADGHVIRCSVTGRIWISMLDDNGQKLSAFLTDVMYVPGLSRRLFSVTQFAQHGHHAMIQQHGTVLLFGSCQSPVTIPHHKHRGCMASNLLVIHPGDTLGPTTYHNVPAYRNKDNNKKCLPLELLHQRLGHRKCRTLLAANEHQLWEDVTIRMTGETGCLTCGIATICSRAHDKEPHTGAT
jgi:hypothetical protein